MIYIDESLIKVGGVVVPGVFKSLEITGEAAVEEQTVEGSNQKPKQATGYEDAKITLELTLEDTLTKTKYDQLTTLQAMFRRTGQSKPDIFTIVNQHTALRGIQYVIFKGLTTKEANTTDKMTASLTFWEYAAVTVTATKQPAAAKAGTAAAAGAPAKKKTAPKKPAARTKTGSGYQRGTAPKQKSKTEQTITKDKPDSKAKAQQKKARKIEVLKGMRQR